MPSYRYPSDALKIKGTPEVWGFDVKDVKTFDDYLKLKQKDRLDRVAIHHDIGDNLVVNAGLDQIGNLILGINTNSFTHNGVGTDGTAAAAGQTALLGQITRVAVNSRYLVSTGAAHFDTFYDSSTGNGTWLETGLFTASVSGTMLARKVIASFTKSTSNTAVVAYTVTFS